MFNDKAQYFSDDFKEMVQEAISKRRPDLIEAFEKMPDNSPWLAGSRFHSNEQVFHAFVGVCANEFGLVGDKFTPESVQNMEIFLRKSPGHVENFAKEALLKAAMEDRDHAQSSAW